MVRVRRSSGGFMTPAIFGDIKAPGYISTILLSVLSASTALAQTNIGSAIEIERNVSGSFAGRTRLLSRGDGVVANENIKTDNASAAQLEFLDQTRLTIGPTSSVVLDRFIYNPDRVPQSGTLQVSSGAARWVGGAAPADAYRVQTPHAVINVRGTVFDLVVEARRTIVTLRQGMLIVCLARQRQRCVTLNTPDSVVVVTATDIRGPFPQASSQTQFSDSCLSPVDRRLSSCAAQAFASLLDIGTPPATPQIGSAPIVTTRSSSDRWSGFYVGANFGYSWGSLDTTTSVDPFSQSSPFSFIFPGGSSSATAKVDGILGGAQFGYNWRLAQTWLAGFEADIQAANQKGSALGMFSGTTSGLGINPACTAVVCTYTNTTDITAKLSWFGTVRGRAGTEVEGLWLYATGGLAYGRVSVSGRNTFTVTETGGFQTVTYSVPFSYSATKVGWVAGVGAENRIGVGRWTWKIEYLHVDLGSVGGGSFGTLPVVNINSVKFTDEIVRFGLNYVFSN
jgi:outer membrane immunogenic protein